MKQRVLEARRAEKAAREAREAAIVDGLSEFLAEVDRAAAVGAKLEGQVAAARAKALERVERIEQETEERIAKLTEAAREETARCERAAGEAVMRLREQGETVTAIASQTGQSHNRVRELGKLATTAQGATEVVPMGSADASGASEDAESAGVNAEEPDVVPVAASDGAGDGVGAEEPAVDAATSLSA